MLEGQVKALESEREKLLRRFKEDKARVWDGETVCSACGQPLPEDRIQEARENFNLRKSRELSEINDQGQLCSASLIAQKSQELDHARAAMQSALERREKAQGALEQAKADAPEQSPFENTQEYADLAAEKANLEAQIKDGGAGADLRRREAQDVLHILNGLIVQAQNDRTLIVTARKRRERLAELEQDQKNTAAEYERFERGVYLCEEFTRAKVSMLDERINSRFHAVRFRLFKTQINGGLQDCCDVLCPTTSGLTPYESANNAAQINAGIEIAGALGAFWGQDRRLVIGLIAAFSWAPVAKQTAAKTRSAAHRTYVRAARSWGAGSWYIFKNHLAADVLPVVLVGALAVVGKAILQESALAYLGLSDPTAKSWGLMINRASRFAGIYFTDYWKWWLAAPVAALMLTILFTRLLARWLEQQLLEGDV